MNQMDRLPHLKFFTLIWIFLSGMLAVAEPPSLTRLFPCGGCVGTNVQVTATGKFTTWPVQVDCQPAVLQWKALEENGKFEVSIPPDAPTQVYWVRFYSGEGSSVVKRFIVDDVPSQQELEPNNSIKAGNAIDALPRQIFGILQKGGDVDVYRVQLSANATLVATVDAQNWLRSPLDAVLQLTDEKGNVVEENIDTHNLDPQIVYTAKRPGVYCVRVMGFPESPDSTISFVGNDNCQYRLTLTTSGHLEAVYPLAVQIQQPTTLQPRGIQMPGNLAPWTPTVDSLGEVYFNHPQTTGHCSVAVVSHPVISEPVSDVNNALTPPLAICGSIQDPQQKDTWLIQLEKDKSYRFETESHTLGFSLDPLVRLLNSEDKEIQKVDESNGNRDPNFVWKANATGIYKLVIEDAEGFSGPLHFYRIYIKPVEPSVKIQGSVDHVEGEIGKPIEVKFTVERLDGFSDVLEAELIVDPNRPLPAECSFSSSVSEKEGDSSKELKWTLQTPVALSQAVRIQIRSKTDPTRLFSVTFGDEKTPNLWLTATPSK
jgi:hypothetical protein